MASVKAEKPLGSQLFGQVKKDSTKPADGATKAPSKSSGTRKTASKSQDAKKKAKGGKSAAKH